MSDLNEVIEDSISDSELPPEVEVDASTETESTPEGSDPPVDETTTAETETTEVPSPAAVEEPAQKDEFEKKFGIPGISPSGRENRIPYPRVKKIAEKAAADAVAEKVKEYEPKIAEYEAKVTDYEGRLGRVAEFEHVMSTDVDTFVGMLKQLPAWQPYFEKVEAALAAYKQPGQTPDQPVADDMPAPDQELSDGTMVYSMDGLKALNAWNRAQARKETLAEVDKKFGPMTKEWEHHQQIQKIIPQIQAQMAEARKWPLFVEHEADIVKALQMDEKLSLEGAYRQVVYPKLVADRTKMREEILKEVQRAPRATTASTTASRHSTDTTPTGPRSLEDVINESIKSLK